MKPWSRLFNLLPRTNPIWLSLAHYRVRRSLLDEKIIQAAVNAHWKAHRSKRP